MVWMASIYFNWTSFNWMCNFHISTVLGFNCHALGFKYHLQLFALLEWDRKVAPQFLFKIHWHFSFAYFPGASQAICFHYIRRWHTILQAMKQAAIHYSNWGYPSKSKRYYTYTVFKAIASSIVTTYNITILRYYFSVSLLHATTVQTHLLHGTYCTVKYRNLGLGSFSLASSISLLLAVGGSATWSLICDLWLTLREKDLTSEEWSSWLGSVSSITGTILHVALSSLIAMAVSSTSLRRGGMGNG